MDGNASLRIDFNSPQRTIGAGAVIFVGAGYSCAYENTRLSSARFLGGAVAPDRMWLYCRY
jgi:hypothetical protein